MIKNKKIIAIVLFSLCLFQPLVKTVSAQDAEDYRVTLRREFGYGAGSNVRGTMTLSLVGDEEYIDQVQFLMDGVEMASVSQAPFKFTFDTDEQGTGVHDLSASVTFKSGISFITPSIRYKFITSEEQNSGMKNLLLPIILILVGSIGVSVLVQMIGKPKKLADLSGPRNYGPLGGTICPKCGHPMPRSILGINMVMGKLQRCESCGRFVITQRATPEALAAAEALEREINPTEEALTKPGEEIKDQLDESKYIDQL